MPDKIRTDVALVRKNICESRERAQTAIMEGRVFLGERRINKASEMVAEDDELTLKAPATAYVSRGALKLEKAVRVFSADIRDRIVMDIGASTGGFTEVCLNNGAAHVYSIDVGYGQLDWKLRNDSRVTVMERTNARYLKPDMFRQKPDVTVMDVSFISIRMIIPVAAEIMGNTGVFYTLIKPQFEAGRKKVGKNGVVRDPETHMDVLKGVIDFAEEIGWRTTGLDYSPITGPKGNIEFLAEIKPKDHAYGMVTSDKICEIVKEAHSKMSHRL